jgi:hypothetical protein
MQKQNDPHLVIPGNFEELIKAIQIAQKEHGPKLMYRGQRNATWEIDSSFTRSLTKEKLERIRNPLTRLEKIPYGIAMNLFLNYFLSMEPSEEVIQKLNGRGCRRFEIARHHQQNFLKSKIHDIKELNLPGSPIIDFTFNALIALFFANFEIDYKTEGLQPRLEDVRSTDAAIFIVNYEAFEIYTSFPELLLSYKLSNMENSGFKKPCIISPLFQLNDENDMKPKRQEAFYVVHVDSRYSLDESLSVIEAFLGKKMYSKITLPKEIFEECKEFLFNRNCTLDYLFPPRIEYQDRSVHKIFQALIPTLKLL